MKLYRNTSQNLHIFRHNEKKDRYYRLEYNNEIRSGYGKI